MVKRSQSPWPSPSADEIEAVVRVLRSGSVNYWTGDRCRTFETRFAEWAGTTHAVALANGTLALEVALKALGIEPDDEVITTPRTFLASASCIVAVGAIPVFADVDPDSQTITADTIRAVMTDRTRAVICVHLGGMPCDMDPIMALAETHDLRVIEDCAQAHGARYRGRSIGSIGHIGAWSFCQDKIMTTGGEGGMVTTNDPALWNFIWSYKDHGKTWRPFFDQAPGPAVPWQFGRFGSNYRMIEMQAAIGLIQLERMAGWTARRTEIALKLAEACAPFSAVRVPLPPEHITQAWYRFYAFARPDHLAQGWTRDRIIEEINALGVPCFHGSASEVYLEAAFDGTGWRPPQRLPVARQLGETSIAFLTHPTLTDDEVAKTAEAIRTVLRRAST